MAERKREQPQYDCRLHHDPFRKELGYELWIEMRWARGAKRPEKAKVSEASRRGAWKF